MQMFDWMEHHALYTPCLVVQYISEVFSGYMLHVLNFCCWTEAFIFFIDLSLFEHLIICIIRSLACTIYTSRRIMSRHHKCIEIVFALTFADNGCLYPFYVRWNVTYNQFRKHVTSIIYIIQYSISLHIYNLWDQNRI